MYGLITRIRCFAGQRDSLVSILLAGTRAMPGCRSYVIAADTSDHDSLWLTEVWVSQSDHRASMALPEVQAAMAKGRPLIAGLGERFETHPIGCVGLDP